METPKEAEAVLEFWFTPRPTTKAEIDERMRYWFTASAETDREIRERFGTLVERARAGELDAWQATPRGALAWLILVDQWSRNLHRNSPEAFAHDAAALAVADAGFADGRFASLGTFERVFAALPFQHAEDLAHQQRAVELAVAEALAAPPELLPFCVYCVDWARKHLDVIARFGRFPHRCEVLGRTPTEREREYLAYLERTGQWL